MTPYNGLRVGGEADALLSNIELAKSVKGIMTPTTNLLKQKFPKPPYKTLAKGASTGFLNAAIQSQATSLNMQHMMEMDQKDLETQMAAQNLVEMKAYQKEMQLLGKPEAWSVAADLSPDVKLAREEFSAKIHGYDKHVDLLRTIDETKSSSYDRIMASVLEGWVF